jgi:hypothetical protein
MVLDIERNRLDDSKSVAKLLQKQKPPVNTGGLEVRSGSHIKKPQVFT